MGMEGGWHCPDVRDMPLPKYTMGKGLHREATSGDLGCLLHPLHPFNFSSNSVLPAPLLIPRRKALPDLANIYSPTQSIN